MEATKNWTMDAIRDLLLEWKMPIDVIEAFHSEYNFYQYLHTFQNDPVKFVMACIQLPNVSENGICIEHLQYLNDEHLKEICPVLGIRINLKNKISELLESQVQ